MLCFQGYQFNLARIIRSQKKVLSELRTQGWGTGGGGGQFLQNESKENEMPRCLGDWVVLTGVKELLQCNSELC